MRKEILWEGSKLEISDLRWDTWDKLDKILKMKKIYILLLSHLPSHSVPFCPIQRVTDFYRWDILGHFLSFVPLYLIDSQGCPTCPTCPRDFSSISQKSVFSHTFFLNYQKTEIQER